VSRRRRRTRKILRLDTPKSKVVEVKEKEAQGAHPTAPVYRKHFHPSTLATQSFIAPGEQSIRDPNKPPVKKKLAL